MTGAPTHEAQEVTGQHPAQVVKAAYRLGDSHERGRYDRNLESDYEQLNGESFKKL